MDYARYVTILLAIKKRLPVTWIIRVGIVLRSVNLWN